jgi:triphosphoribosyl-dephospho-CoA synthase
MPFSTAEAATLACLWEAIASKPGNVHRGADFDDVTFGDFATSAVLIGPIVAEAAARGVGATVLDAVRVTREAVGTNTNLGMLLLLAPLCAVPRDEPLRPGVARVLAELTPDDAARVYEAISLARPGGLGEAQAMDVAGPPPASLLAAMRLAAERDLVARQYAGDFADVFDHVATPLVEACRGGLCLTEAIIATFVRRLAAEGDTLIARKCGVETSQRAATLAAQVLAAGPPGDENYQAALADLDFWLRSDGHRRNPGATADLIAAGLFVVFRDRLIAPPWR